MNHVRLQRTLTLTNDLSTIPQLNEFLDLIFEEVGVDMEVCMSLNLAMEEAVVNVIDYAYPQGTSGSIDINVLADEDSIVFVITDSGIPFDPTAAKEVDTTLPLEERPIGGLGIHLIRKIMDDVSYERRDNKNILTLRKNINSENNH